MSLLLGFTINCTPTMTSSFFPKYKERGSVVEKARPSAQRIKHADHDPRKSGSVRKALSETTNLLTLHDPFVCFLLLPLAGLRESTLYKMNERERDRIRARSNKSERARERERERERARARESESESEINRRIRLQISHISIHVSPRPPFST